MTAAADLEVVAGNVERLPTESVRHVVTGLRQAIVARARRDTGGDMRLSHDRRNERLDITTAVGGGDRVAHGQVIPGPTRAVSRWRWLNDGTRPRVQGSGRHPGTRGKRTIDAAVDRALPDLERDVAHQFDQVTG